MWSNSAPVNHMVRLWSLERFRPSLQIRHGGCKINTLTKIKNKVRGGRQEAIYEDQEDRQRFLGLLGSGVGKERAYRIGHESL